MKSYYQIKKETDLLGSFDLLEMQAYILLLKYLLRMGKKEGVTPAEDWEKVKDLMARVTNHISFHARGVKPSEVTVEFYSPEVKQLFHAVYGDGNATWTKEWLDTFESVKDEIDRQVENERPMCQYGAVNGKRCDKCQCPDPLSEQEYPTEKAKAWLSMFDESDTAPGVDDGETWDKARQREDERNAALQKEIAAETSAKIAGDTEKPRFVVTEMATYHCYGGYGICDTTTEIDHLYTASKKSAVAIAELLNFTIAGG